MNARVKRYWDDNVRFYKRDRSQGNFFPEDVVGDWEDKVEYRSRELDPSVTRSQYVAYVNSKMGVSRAPVKRVKSPRKKTTPNRSGFASFAFQAGKTARSLIAHIKNRKS